LKEQKKAEARLEEEARLKQEERLREEERQRVQEALEAENRLEEGNYRYYKAKHFTAQRLKLEREEEEARQAQEKALREKEETEQKRLAEKAEQEAKVLQNKHETLSDLERKKWAEQRQQVTNFPTKYMLNLFRNGMSNSDSKLSMHNIKKIWRRRNMIERTQPGAKLKLNNKKWTKRLKSSRIEEICQLYYGTTNSLKNLHKRKFTWQLRI
jgi:hypothetical protein